MLSQQPLLLLLILLGAIVLLAEGEPWSSGKDVL
jgi:hypothetical protein